MHETLVHAEFIYADTKQSLDNLVGALLEESHRDVFVERRRRHRHPLSKPVNVTPLSEDCQPLGNEIPALTHDISTAGISILNVAPIEHRYLMLRFPGELRPPRAAMVEVVRHERAGPLWIIAGKFLVKP